MRKRMKVEKGSRGGKDGKSVSGKDGKAQRKPTPHDEAFKKLLQTFFQEFIELFFPEVGAMLDYSQTRFLMQEQLVDVVGEKEKTLDLLMEVRYRETKAYVLVHFEPQSYKDKTFRERMFVYFGRLFERHRKNHKLIIPIAIFTADRARNEPDTLTMALPEHEILRFQFLKVVLKSNHWRQFIQSDNPVAAALLAKMGYNEEEKREVRKAYLRMLLRLRGKYDEARVALVASIADLYFKPDPKEEEEIRRELREENPEQEEQLMELMPAWKRWGYEEGIVKGREEGKLEGKQEGKLEGKQEGRMEIIRKLLSNGFSPEEVARMIEAPVDEIRHLAEKPH